jgi:hypothetical protein
MPYYFGEGDPAWDDYIEQSEAEIMAGLPPPPTPREHFASVEPWEAKTSVVHFPRTPLPLSDRTHAPVAEPVADTSTAGPGWLSHLFDNATEDDLAISGATIVTRTGNVLPCVRQDGRDGVAVRPASE